MLDAISARGVKSKFQVIVPMRLFRQGCHVRLHHVCLHCAYLHRLFFKNMALRIREADTFTRLVLRQGWFGRVAMGFVAAAYDVAARVLANTGMASMGPSMRR